jgi:TetR/AcrR family transcriptional regulator
VAELPDTQIALLEAAEALFARQGYAATTIKAIGAEAGVNPALLYYYFPDKERLYHAVLERRLGGFARQMAADLPDGLPPLEAIERILRGYAAMMQRAPQLPRLLARELADHEAEHALPLIREIAAGLFRRICDLIRAAQRSGEIRADLDPRFTAISLVSQMAWFFVAKPAVSRMLGHEGAVPPAQVARYVEHAVAFTLAALAPVATPPAVPSARKRVSR